jgi:hypothetical protein
VRVSVAQVVVSDLSGAIAVGAAAGAVGALDLSQLDVDALSRAIRRAEDVSCKSVEATELLTAAKQIKKLRTALAAGSWDSVKAVLEETKELVIAESAMGEFLLAQDELDNQSLLEALSEALETGSASGTVGAVDLSSVQVCFLWFGCRWTVPRTMCSSSLFQVNVLDRAIAFGLEHGAKTPEAQRLLSAAKLIRRLRSVILSGNWEWVGGVLSDARAMKDSLPVCCLKELQVSLPGFFPGRLALSCVIRLPCMCFLWLAAAGTGRVG